MKNGKNFDWQAYDDRIAQKSGSGSLVVTKPRDEDFGTYVCFKIIKRLLFNNHLIKQFL